MRGMLDDMGHRLKGGAVVVSRTVRVEGSGESLIAAPLEAVAKAHPEISLGSYPFYGAEGFGSNLVLRGRDPAELAATVDELIAALKAAGVANLREVEAEPARP
jgi:molybdopterin-biosynthesis enzyme MoeA-like protein